VVDAALDEMFDASRVLRMRADDRASLATRPAKEPTAAPHTCPCDSSVGPVASISTVRAWLRTGRSGRAWRMIRDHEVAAPMMGIPVARYKLLVFVISSALIGMQGALTAHFVGSLSYEAFTLNLAISYIAMILIGGADSQAGPLIGAVLVSTMPTFVPDLVSRFAGGSVSAVHTAAYSQITYGALIIVFIVFAPRGVNGWFVDIAAWSRRKVSTHRQQGTAEFGPK